MIYNFLNRFLEEGCWVPNEMTKHHIPIPLLRQSVLWSFSAVTFIVNKELFQSNFDDSFFDLRKSITLFKNIEEDKIQ
jgi:hypothetical protein